MRHCCDCSNCEEYIYLAVDGPMQEIKCRMGHGLDANFCYDYDGPNYEGDNK